MDRIEKIFDYSSTFESVLFDEIVQVAYNSSGQERDICMKALNRFQEHSESWIRVDQILESCQLPQSKFIGLAVMEKFIQTRWKSIDKAQREAIKGFLVNLLLKDGSVASPSSSHKLYLRKLDLIIVELLKQEWPHDWPNFINDLISSSRNCLAMCENNMQILMFLSEEVFDFSEEQMTQNKIRLLKSQMEVEFNQIFQLCMEVLVKAQTASLITVTLETLLRFLNWIPIQFVFESDLLNILCQRFLEDPLFRNLTIKCMTQIGTQIGTSDYDSRFLLMFNVVLGSVKRTIPIDIDLAQGYENGDNDEQEYVQNIALFFTGFLEKHLDLIEKQAPRDDLLLAHSYLVKICQVEEREVFKICLEYWNKLLASLFAEVKQLAMMRSANPADAIVGAPPPEILKDFPLRKHCYAPVLSDLRVVVIDRMVRPEEVLIVENEDGEVIREFTKETDTITLYKSMRECLVYLTHMDVVDTEDIMTRKLAAQIDDTAWSRNMLNRLCWSIGSISGAMHEDSEKRFLVSVIKDLLSLCDFKRGKDNKAIVASNIMYIVGQYPRFLRAHWKFLKTVANKLFEFMHESHEGVQDMACDTFMQIAQSCKRHFVVPHADEDMFIRHILVTLPDITRDLSPPQTHSVIEACGHIISASLDAQLQIDMIAKLLETTNYTYSELMKDPNLLESNEKVKMLGNCLKANTAACRSVGAPFSVQLSSLFGNLLILFKQCSAIINDSIASQGPVAVRTPKVRHLRLVRKESLRLLEVYITQAKELSPIADDMLPALIENYLFSYSNSLLIAREPEILDLFSTLTDRLKDMMGSKVVVIFNSILQCTIDAIKDNFTDFPDIRTSFYKLLHKLVQNCFESVLLAPIELFDCFMITVVFGFKHTMRDISETALSISYDMFNQVMNCEQNLRDSFIQAFLFTQLTEVLHILFDADHKNGFNSQCKLIAHLVRIIESGAISTQIQDPQFPRTMNMTSNSQYLFEYLVSMISRAYPHLAANTVSSFVKGLEVYCNDMPKFKLHVRDFLISLKEFGSDNSDLYLADRELEMAQKRKEEHELALMVPGLVKPADLPSTMED